jgi:hypothetical protein
MIANKLANEKKIADFVNYMYLDGPKAIKPEAVNVVRWPSRLWTSLV